MANSRKRSADDSQAAKVSYKGTDQVLQCMKLVCMLLTQIPFAPANFVYATALAGNRRQPRALQIAVHLELLIVILLCFEAGAPSSLSHSMSYIDLSVGQPESSVLQLASKSNHIRSSQVKSNQIKAIQQALTAVLFHRVSSHQLRSSCTLNSPVSQWRPHHQQEPAGAGAIVPTQSCLL